MYESIERERRSAGPKAEYWELVERSVEIICSTKKCEEDTYC